MKREPSKEEIEYIGKIIQRNLATRTVGFDDTNYLALTIRDEENVRVRDMSIQFGFKSFKELLESPMMAKFVEVIVSKDGNKFKTTYKAKMDATTRNVMEQQKWFYETEGRLKEQRRQNIQVPNNGIYVAKRRFSLMHLTVNHPSFFQKQPMKANGKENNCPGAGKSDPNKWKLDFLTTPKDDEKDNKLSESRKTVAPPLASLSFSPSSPTKKRSSECQVFFSIGWKLLELPDKHYVIRRDGICEKNPEYNVDNPIDPRRSPLRPMPSNDIEWLEIPEFFATFLIDNVLLLNGSEGEVTADEGETNNNDVGSCDLIDLRTNNDSSNDDELSRLAMAATTAHPVGILTEEKMRLLGKIATTFCKYKFKYCSSTPVKFNSLHKVLSDCEPLFDDKLMKDSQQLEDFFTLFCPKLELVYPPTKHPLAKARVRGNGKESPTTFQFHLYYNAMNNE